MQNKKIKKPFPFIRLFTVLFLSAAILAIIIPLMFFVTISFSSDREMSNFPMRLFPTLNRTVKIEYIENSTDKDFMKYRLYIKESGDYEAVLVTAKAATMSEYLRRYYSILKSEEEVDAMLTKAKAEGEATYKLKKDMFYNFKGFFDVTSNGAQSLLNSVIVAFMTIIISLTFGSMAGYAMARYKFRGKEKVNMALLLVRMFPIVAISIPMATLLIKFNLFDTYIGLAIIYSIPNIALTAWITRSIFVGINPELEEASMVFGASRLKTFFKITLPMTLPAIAASSMYAFLTAWNDTISALILTDTKSTLSLVVYRAVGSATSDIQFAAAGSIILILPALVFTLIIRKYIGNMWGNTSA